MPPVEWAVGAHVKHLRNLYVYFWRWAFGGSIVTPDTPPMTPQQGVMCFITVANFSNRHGFQKMRADLRRDTDEIWVIDCSPEGQWSCFPIMANASVTEPNIRPAVLPGSAKFTTEQPRRRMSSPISLIASVAAHPAYTARLAPDLVHPALRIPLTGDTALFVEAVRLGREVIRLHTFGERFVDAVAGRPPRSARLAQGPPRISAVWAIPSDPAHMPDTISYDAANRRLWIKRGHIDNVGPGSGAATVSACPAIPSL